MNLDLRTEHADGSATYDFNLSSEETGALVNHALLDLLTKLAAEESRKKHTFDTLNSAIHDNLVDEHIAVASRLHELNMYLSNRPEGESDRQVELAALQAAILRSYSQVVLMRIADRNTQ